MIVRPKWPHAPFLFHNRLSAYETGMAPNTVCPVASMVMRPEWPQTPFSFSHSPQGFRTPSNRKPPFLFTMASVIIRPEWPINQPSVSESLTD
eukprot:3100978-Lingulodinium_polyedra.AAC.1